MLYSKLFGKTIKETPKDEESINAKLLIRAGFIRKEMAGVYNFLPLGLRVINKISNIIREEMNTAGGQELLLSSLQKKESWETTGRWTGFDALFKLTSQFEKEYALGPTHEEVLVPIVSGLVSSYKDLPLYLYQIQNKFRDEARAKAGLLRGREFLMKDLYSFHTDEKDLADYYEKMKKAYASVFKRVGLDAIQTRASGGTFSEFSDEYQVICESGEDEIIYCPGGDFSENTEISKVAEGKQCDLGHGALAKVKTIEVGNIFQLKDKYSKAFGLKFKDKIGSEKFVMMGCYGIGVSRLMGTIAEVYNDEKGMKWPASVAPFDAQLITTNNSQPTTNNANKVYKELQRAGVDVLYDDRDVRAGEKFADADLIGIPVRLVISEKTLRQGSGQAQDKIEFKKRDEEKSELLDLNEVIKRVLG
ncbi:MAG: aminoacyl--tRNA ligase-related protein [Patescibacteria group bacterium]